jgi:hypothetical protein
MNLPRIPANFITARFNDHEFVRYLRKQGAVYNYEHKGTSCTWRNPQDKIVALAFYDNASSSREIFIPRTDK